MEERPKALPNVSLVEGSRHRSRDGCMRIRDRPRKAEGRLSGPTCHGWWRNVGFETRPGGHGCSRFFTGVQGTDRGGTRPDAVALEESYVGADARIALSVGQARGSRARRRVRPSARRRALNTRPARVKTGPVCGYGARREGSGWARDGEGDPLARRGWPDAPVTPPTRLPVAILPTPPPHRRLARKGSASVIARPARADCRVVAGAGLIVDVERCRLPRQTRLPSVSGGLGKAAR